MSNKLSIEPELWGKNFGSFVLKVSPSIGLIGWFEGQVEHSEELGFDAYLSNLS